MAHRVGKYRAYERPLSNDWAVYFSISRPGTEHEAHPAPHFVGWAAQRGDLATFIAPGVETPGSTIDYLITLATTPAPTVRPPSRMAKRRPSAIAIGAIRATTIFTLSPGITISTPSGNWQAPVTSVVRK